MNCAAAHRSLGTSTTRVKSVVFDKWDVPTTRAFLEGGNERARSIYLARLPRGYAEPTPASDAAERHAFVRKKYVRMRWAEEAFRSEQQAARRAVRPRTGAAGRDARPDRAGPMPSLSSEA